MVVDADGVEWEIFDEGAWSLGLALDWDYLPQPDNPGLIFSSRLGRRRLWPCPPDWRDLPDRSLIDLLGTSASL